MKIAGIDVHQKVLMVVVIDATRPEEKPERQRFTTLPSDLRRLSSWLRGQDVQEAVMESTAQYRGAAYLAQPDTASTQGNCWRSVWLELEPHMLLHLAHAFSNRATTKRHSRFYQQPPIKGLHEPFLIWVACTQRVGELVGMFTKQFVYLRRLADLPRVRTRLLRG